MTPTVLPGGAGVGFTETKSNKNISCYPNPASDKITIRSNEFDLRGAMVSIVDVTGKLVYSTKLGADNFSSVVLNIPTSLSNGFYIVEIRSSNQLVSDRLVINRN